MGLDFTIQYKKGVDNKVAYALSRRMTYKPILKGNSRVNVISGLTPTWVEEIIASYEHDGWAQESMATTIVDPTNYTQHVSVSK